jgi:hypothetical protein
MRARTCCQNASNASRVWLGCFEHPAYSPDLTPSDFHLFPKLNEFLGADASKAMKK